mmetsp:Transcript_12959/g.52158  ORF Transcript_12959/g.52158 Transcript_12959/m.52158 type:complete len:525 (-) Transcript_12959:3629-5203(-)
MTPPPPPLPDGVSFGTAPGGVRVINIRFDEDEWETRWAKVPHATLRHPETRAAVTLIGTAHVSKAAAEETRELITRERPDVVVLELDPHRLNALVRDAHTAKPCKAAADRFVSTSLFQSGPTRAIGLAYSLVGALLGTTPGAEFLAAIDAAKEVGAEVVLGDLDVNITTSRAWKRQYHELGRIETYRGRPRVSEDEAVDEDLLPSEDLRIEIQNGEGEPIPVKYRLPSTARRIMRDAGCGANRVELDKVEESVWRLLGRPVRVDDIARLRGCGEKVLDYARSDDFLKQANLDGAPAMQKTIKEDRDLVLAHSLHRAAGRARVKKVVGVVGAAHIPGIKEHWNSVPTDESRDRYNETLNPIPKECADDMTPGFFLGLCSGAGAALYMGVTRYTRNRFEVASKHVEQLENVEQARAYSRLLGQTRTRWLGRTRMLEFALVGSVFMLGATTYALVSRTKVALGELATGIERAAQEGEAQGLLSRRRNELRSDRWTETDELGNRKIEVRATNAVSAYPPREDKKYLFR